MKPLRWLLLIVPLGALALALAPLLRRAGAAPGDVLPEPRLGEEFAKVWSDGAAELAGYDLTFPRYGQPRHGETVTIFCTEKFGVMKLNLVQDFGTGIYDYNLMTSVFTTLAAVNGRGIGSTTKISFGSQEWCGNVFQELLFDADAIRSARYSYFDGEADQQEKFAYPTDGVSEDALLLWARGLAAPRLDAGQSRQVNLLRSVRTTRLLHKPLEWQKATLSRTGEERKVTVPAGDFVTEICTARIDGGRAWTFYVEKDSPHRLIQWECNDGEENKLLGSDRLKYWQMNAPGFESELKKLGLQSRPPRTT
jgi:hypothetical protein